MERISGGDTATIGTETTRIIARGGTIAAHTPYSDTVMISITLTDRFHFKKGDILRVTAKVWANRLSGGTADIGIGHDPQNRNDPRAAASAKRMFEDDKNTITTIFVPWELNF